MESQITKNAKVFSEIIKEDYVSPTDFFSISITDYSVCFLGNMKVSKLAKYRNRFMDATLSADENGFVTLEFKENEVQIKITFC
jgi:roadblock/LC7 domain-containing protein